MAFSCLPCTSWSMGPCRCGPKAARPCEAPVRWCMTQVPAQAHSCAPLSCRLQMLVGMCEQPWEMHAESLLHARFCLVPGLG